jgi:hypothetical protein
MDWAPCTEMIADFLPTSLIVFCEHNKRFLRPKARQRLGSHLAAGAQNHGRFKTTTISFCWHPEGCAVTVDSSQSWAWMSSTEIAFR